MTVRNNTLDAACLKTSYGDCPDHLQRQIANALNQYATGTPMHNCAKMQSLSLPVLKKAIELYPEVGLMYEEAQDSRDQDLVDRLYELGSGTYQRRVCRQKTRVDAEGNEIYKEIEERIEDGVPVETALIKYFEVRGILHKKLSKKQKRELGDQVSPQELVQAYMEDILAGLDPETKDKVAAAIAGVTSG